MNPVAGLVVEGWNDLDRVIDAVPPEDAVANVEGQSSIAWALGHLTEHVATGPGGLDSSESCVRRARYHGAARRQIQLEIVFGGALVIRVQYDDDSVRG